MHLSNIQSRIIIIREQRVILDYDLAELYETETKRLKEAVRRHIERFPEDFMFELTNDEFETLRSQFATSNRGGSRYPPFAFTEQGVAMLSSVLNSKKAIDVNIAIMRTFVALRLHFLNQNELADKLKELEIKYNQQFKDVYAAINYLLNKDKLDISQKERKKIGFNR
ncbi:MAG: ORF6N domain-containing protein [Bacteroidetes bacterium]|nr:MAG: ORF6N domain-containing protein [Bacteroidota bacterium]REK04999.1 MAG: ORF6N domain-containing protein [Bacteroidota bacterium]REK36497.1 MAG: ORF6N domain-containing protein [Bacteroidota bacterium]REK51711.1 MAG: ORF6N domain-containing protein [Bacteroidota bacterium]